MISCDFLYGGRRICSNIKIGSDGKCNEHRDILREKYSRQNSGFCSFMLQPNLRGFCHRTSSHGSQYCDKHSPIPTQLPTQLPTQPRTIEPMASLRVTIKRTADEISEPPPEKKPRAVSERTEMYQSILTANAHALEALKKCDESKERQAEIQKQLQEIVEAMNRIPIVQTYHNLMAQNEAAKKQYNESLTELAMLNQLHGELLTKYFGPQEPSVKKI